MRALGKRGSEKGLWGLTREATVSETCPVSFVPPHPGAGRMRGGRGERPQPSAHTLRGFLGIGGRAAGSQIP